MLLAGLLFTVMLGLVKVAREDLSALEVACWRSVTALPLSFVLARRAGIAVRSKRTLLLRCALGFGAVFGFFTAAKGLSMGQLSLISKVQPILVAVLAPLALGADERPGGRTWLVLAMGLTGSAILLSPDLTSGSVYGLFALLATVSSAGAHVAVRKLGRTDNPFALVFWFQLAICVLAFVAYAAVEGHALPLPPTSLWPVLLGVGVVTTGGQLAMTKAYQLDKASTVAAASYAAPLFAVIGDVIVFSIWPDAWAIGGGVLIVGAGAVLVLRRAREPAPVSTP